MIRSMFQQGEATITSTGTQNNVSYSECGVLRCNNASDLTITGFAAGVAGQVLAVFSVGAGNVYLVPNSGSSSVGNKLANFIGTGNTPLAAGAGSAVYQYDATAAVWRLRNHEQGAPIAEAFAAGKFTANGAMTWTVASGDVDTYNYYIRGNQLFFTISLSTTTVGGVVDTELRVQVPGGYTATGFEQGIIWLVSNLTQQAGRFFTTAGTTISLSLITGANWTAGADVVYVSGSGFFRVN